MLEGFTEWLGATELSAVFSDTTQMKTWLILPVSQSIHILCVAVVMISVAMLNLQLMGVRRTRLTSAQLASNLMPWMWGALIGLFITGVVQTIAEPGRELLNIGFRTKMTMLAITVAIALFYEHALKTDPKYFDNSPERRRLAQILATVSLVLWFGIAVAGRMIAYLDMRNF